MPKYIIGYQCVNCDHVQQIKLGVCEVCGDLKDYMWINGYDGWNKVAARWVSHSVWWNPFSWDKGHWEAKED